MRVASCTGLHICKVCKGTGVVGNIVKRKCERGHIETTTCAEYQEPHLISPVSVDGYVRLQKRGKETSVYIKWATIKHHSWKGVPKCVSCNHTHLANTFCGRYVRWVDTGNYSYRGVLCDCK